MCDHYEIVNHHEGETVCCLCGVILSSQYYENLPLKDNSICHASTEFKWVDEAKNVLDRMHLTLQYSDDIIKYLYKNYKVKNDYNLAYSIYKVLNEVHMVPVTLQEICNTTGARKKSVFMHQPLGDNIVLDKTDFVVKYCTLLGAGFKNVSLVKELISKQKPSGHSPTTIIAGCLYIILKKLKHKVTIKKVSQVTAVSPISIQRFIKNANT